jgi:hypothetical protein
MSNNSNEPLDYECCDEHEVSYMGACGLCLTEEINEMLAEPKAISLVDKDFLKAVLSFIPAPATSSDASELVKEILAETEHWDVMPECREKGDLELVIGLLKRCLPLLPSNERVSKKEAQLLVGALQEFHVLSDLGGDIEDHEVGEI